MTTKQKKYEIENYLKWIIHKNPKENKPLVIAGDFNNNRNNTCNKIWSEQILEEISKSKNNNLTKCTPKGSSWNEFIKNDIVCFAIDHFLRNNGFKEVEGSTNYDMNFCKDHNIMNGTPYKKILHWKSHATENWTGENTFFDYGNKKKFKNKYENGISPYQDHAILVGEFE